MRHLIPLLVRSRVLRGLAVAAAIVGFAAGMFKAISDAYVLSPEQEASKILGQAGGIVEVMSPAPAGEYPPKPEVLQSVPQLRVSAEYRSTVDLAQEERAARFVYIETSFPVEATNGRLELVAGEYPRDPGECVSQTPIGGVWKSTHQTWELSVVGQFREIYAQGADVLLCAPGTWEMRAGSGMSFESLDANYYVQGPEDSLTKLQSLVAGGEKTEMISVLLRSQILQGQGISAQQFLGGYSLVYALLLGVPFVFGGRLARWVAGVQMVLSRSGVQPRLIRTAALSTMMVAVTVMALGGCLAGILGGLACYPVLRQINHGLPLGPWQLDLWCLLAAALALIGALCGFLALNASQHVRARLAQRPTRPLSPRAALVLGWVSAGLFALSIWSLLTSSGKLWPMSLGVVFAVLGAAALAPRLAQWVSQSLASPPTSPRDLAARLLKEDGTRWAGVSGTATLLIGLVLSVMINISASVSAQIQLMASPVPSGMALLEIVTPEGTALPDQVLAEFESENAITHGVRLRDTLFGDGENGVVQVFDSPENARSVLGLDADQTRFLAEGGVLRIGGTSEHVELWNMADPSQFVSVEVMGFKPELPHRLATGYGFAIADTLPPDSTTSGVSSVWLVYTGLTSQQTEALQAWPIESGHGDVNIRTHRSSDGINLPLWLAVGFVALALVAIPLLVWSLQREILALRPFAKNLIGMGLPISWARSVLAAVIGPILVVPLLLGLAVGFGSTAALHWLYPSVFDLAGINYLGLGLFVATLVLAGGTVVMVGSRQLHSSPPSSVV